MKDEPDLRYVRRSNFVEDVFGFVGEHCEVRPIERDFDTLMTVFAVARPLETVTVIYAQGGDIGVQAAQHQDRATSERQLSFDLPTAAKDFAFGGLISTIRNNKTSQSGFMQRLQHHGYLLKGASTPVGRDAPTRETSLPDGKDM